MDYDEFDGLVPTMEDVESLEELCALLHVLSDKKNLKFELITLCQKYLMTYQISLNKYHKRMEERKAALNT